MSTLIEIDDDVLQALKERAIPFEDHAPNDVLRRLLLEGNKLQSTEDMAVARRQRSGQASKPSPSAKRRRAPSSALLPETEYRYPILRALSDNGGRMPTSEAVAAVGELVENKLLPADLEMLGKRPRWEGRVQFTRLQLIKDGLMKKDSPRGVWEITNAGEEAVKEQLRAATVASVRAKRGRAGTL